MSLGFKRLSTSRPEWLRETLADKSTACQKKNRTSDFPHATGADANYTRQLKSALDNAQ